MKVVTERKLTEAELIKLDEQGIDEVYFCKQLTIRDFYKGESVGFYLDVLYKPNIDLINDLLFRKHPVTLKYKGTTYKLNSIDEWTYSYQSDEDQLKTKRYNHPILQAYYEQRKEYFDKLKRKQRKEQYDIVCKLNNDLSDDELEIYLSTFGRLYDIHIDFNDTISKLNAYQQLKWYVDNNIEYAREVRCIAPEETPYFTSDMFQEDTSEEDITEVLVGDDGILEDYAYKKSTGHIFNEDEIIKLSV